MEKTTTDRGLSKHPLECTETITEKFYPITSVYVSNITIHASGEGSYK